MLHLRMCGTAIGQNNTSKLISAHLQACMHSQDYFSVKYLVMFYIRTNTIGIRQKFGKEKQIFGFGGKKCSLKESQLRAWADDVLKRLDDGEKPMKVKKWIKGIVGPK